ncbi:MAG: hypothetical protein WBX25_29975 [Rhodomicrobium sp.]
MLTIKQPASDFLAEWAKDRVLSPTVTNLMGFLALAELAGEVRAQPTGTKFVKGNGPRDLDLDALHAAAVAAQAASKTSRRAARKAVQA